MKKILRFTASWCNPCKMLAANLQEVNTDVSIEVVDIDSSPDIATEYRIRSVPTLVMLKEDKEIKRLIGNKSTKELREWIEND
jgi:thioredoxin 1